MGIAGLVIGIIFSAKGLSKNKQDGHATGGLVTSIIGVVLSVLITIALVPEISKNSNASFHVPHKRFS